MDLALSRRPVSGPRTEYRPVGQGLNHPGYLVFSPQPFGGTYSGGLDDPSPKKYFSHSVIQIFCPCSLVRSSRYSFTSIFECSIQTRQASFETLSKICWPIAPLNGGRSRPSISLPNFTQFIVRGIFASPAI